VLDKRHVDVEAGFLRSHLNVRGYIATRPPSTAMIWPVI
jgi:hypothetical protein